jgi:hypothetical protein
MTNSSGAVGTAERERGRERERERERGRRVGGPEPWQR